VDIGIDEVPNTRPETRWVGVDQVEGGSFFDDESVEAIPALTLFDAAIRAATAMLGRLDTHRSASCVAAVDVAFPGPCRRGVPVDLRLGSPDFQRDSSGVRFEVAQGDVDVCVGRVLMSYADNDELLAPWIVSLGRRAEHALIGKRAPWRVLIGPPHRTEEGYLAADMVGPSAASDTGAHPVSLVVEAACQVAAIVAKTSGTAQRDSRFVLSSVEVSLLADEPWESYPEIICYSAEVDGQRLSMSMGLRVDGVPRGSLLIAGQVPSSSHRSASAALAGKGLGVRP